jgi:hypothetical protein
MLVALVWRVSRSPAGAAVAPEAAVARTNKFVNFILTMCLRCVLLGSDTLCDSPEVVVLMLMCFGGLSSSSYISFVS